MGDAGAIGLDGVWKRYRRTDRWVLSDVAVELAPASTVEVLGRNGAGKSTLLRLIAGATEPTRGRRAARPEVRVGYVPEQFSPPPPFTAAAYLRHLARIRGLGAGEGERQWVELAGRLGFEGLLGERLGALSHGSLQKVLLTQALIGGPTLLVLDEPFAGLDAEAQQALCTLLREHAEAGAAVLFSDHREGSVRPLADRTWRLADGRVDESAQAELPAPVSAALTFEGVRVAAAGPASIRLFAAPAASDRALAVLLSEGWHIEQVGRDGGDEHEITATREQSR